MPACASIRAFLSVRSAPAPKNLTMEEAMKKSAKKVISYRRRCLQLGQNTGLSHYILLAPKADSSN